MDRPPPERTAGRLVFAWSVHLLTATGAVLAFLALLAVGRGEFDLALWWLVAALAVDAFDGTLARAAHVKTVAPNSMNAPPVSAQKPWCGVSRVILEPIVWTIRQPPISVPRPIAAWHEITTQNGIENSVPRWPCE